MGAKTKGSIGAGRFKLGERLGRGSYGEVYKALDEEDGEEVALKALDPLGVDALQRFKNEFRALVGVTHPNLAALHDLIAEGERWFFTMELVEGVDVLTELFDGDDEPDDVDEKTLRSLLTQVAAGLHALHRAGRCHEDLKPSNALVSQEGTVKLLDFSVLSAIGKEVSHDDAPPPSPYAAPELSEQPEATEAADWYAFGVILHQTLTGKLPERGEGGASSRRKRGGHLSSRARYPSAPGDLCELAEALLSDDPRSRPAGDQVIEALRGDRPSQPSPRGRGRAAKGPVARDEVPSGSPAGASAPRNEPIGSTSETSGEAHESAATGGSDHDDQQAGSVGVIEGLTAGARAVISRVRRGLLGGRRR